MEQRIFQFDGQWNIVYYPERPSGFAVMILGDRHHYVDKEGSYWQNHPGRSEMLQLLKDSGYTLFASNLYRPNWGNDLSVHSAIKLRHLLMKSEILNDRIHILAEGTGALTALKLMTVCPEGFRSAVFLNPCLSLSELIQRERERKVYFKGFEQEIAQAYNLDAGELNLLEREELRGTDIKTPLQIIHVLGGSEEDQSYLYKELEAAKQAGSEVEIQYLLAEKRYKCGVIARQFFKRHEKYL
ncbi:hypothetical protein V1498_16430 [Peribacillus sp. SCS-26]|uniref:hypothetical protein n=1 Tax=Paraperibacillus marinus TaxID=3115295 RepID=UPI0039064983